MKQEQSQALGNESAPPQADVAGLLPGKRTLTEAVTPARGGDDLDSIDRQVAQLPADQRAYYEQIIAESPTPNDKKTRKDALDTVKTSRPLSPEDQKAIIAARDKLASMKAVPVDDGNNPHRIQLEITFDGTWNSRDDMLYDTNPALINGLFEGAEQDKNYQIGVGTSWWTKLWGGATGAGISNRIDAAYQYVVNRVNQAKSADPQAEVILIVTGFSRGSTAARAFVNELNKRGVPDLTSINDKGDYTRFFEGPRIGVMVLFDTVGSVGIPGNEYNPGLDLTIPANAENVLHLTAGDEHRAMFPLSSAVDPANPDDSRITEIQLPGAHSDVGGSYPNAYSKVSLHMAQDYMVQRGVKVKPVNDAERIDPADPRLRLHDSGGSKNRQRTVYGSKNPKAPTN